MFVVAGWTAFKRSPTGNRVFGRFSLRGKKWRGNYAELRLLLLLFVFFRYYLASFAFPRPLYNLNSRNKRVNVLIIAETFHLDRVGFAYFQSTCPGRRKKTKNFSCYANHTARVLLFLQAGKINLNMIRRCQCTLTWNVCYLGWKGM